MDKPSVELKEALMQRGIYLAESMEELDAFIRKKFNGLSDEEVKLLREKHTMKWG